MEIQTTIKWYDKYLPLNSRKATYNTFSGVITNNIKEVEKNVLNTFLRIITMITD